MKIAGAQHPLDQPEEEGRAELVLDQAGQPDRDDEEEADREQHREGDRQAPDPAADLFLLALLVLLELGVGGDRQGAEADLQRLAEGDDAAQHRQPPEAVALWPRADRLGADLDLAVGAAHRHGPDRDAAHHHALEHRLAADRRVALGDQRAVGHAQRVGPVLGRDGSFSLRRAQLRAHGLPPGLGVLGGAALEALDPAARVDELLLAGVERVALRAELDVQVGLASSACRTGCRTSSARWRACTQGEFRFSSSFSLDDARKRPVQGLGIGSRLPIARAVETTETDAERQRPAPRVTARVLAVLLLGGTALVALHDWLGVGGGLDFAIGGAALRRGRARRRRGLPDPGLGLPARARGLDADRPGDPLLGRRRGLLDRSSSKATPPPPIPRRPTSATSPSTRSPTPAWRCWSAPGRTRSTGGSGWTALIAALGTAALGAAFVFDFVAEQDRPARTLEVADHARLPARRHRDARDGRRRDRPDRLAAGPDLVAAARRPLGAGHRRHRLHPAVDRRSPAGRRLDRPDLPDRRRLPRRRRLAAGRGGRDHLRRRDERAPRDRRPGRLRRR